MFDRMIQRSIIGALHSSKKPSTTATSSSTSTKSVMIPATVTASTSKPTVVSLPSPPDLKNDQLARLSLYLIQRLWHTIDNKCPERAFSLTKSFERVISKSRVSSQVVYTALIYLHRLFIRSNRQVSRDSELNLFGIAVMLAQKYLDDNRYSNRSWAGILGDRLRLEDLNKMEMEFLLTIRFDIHVTERDYFHWTLKNVWALSSEARLFFQRMKELTMQSWHRSYSPHQLAQQQQPKSTPPLPQNSLKRHLHRAIADKETAAAAASLPSPDESPKLKPASESTLHHLPVICI